MYFPSFIPILTLLELLAAQSTSVVSDIASPSDVPVCYSPDKSVAIDNYACNLSANVSVCCGVGSICLDNKICQNGNDQIIRGACTDSTWQSPECPQYCMGASTGGTDLISCQNVTNNALYYCCDHTNNCCNGGVGRFQLSGTGIPFTTIASSASTATRHLSTSASSLPTTTAASSPSSSLVADSPTQTTASLPSATSSPSAGLGTSAKVGIAVGVSAGVVIIAVLSLSLWWSLRTRALPKREVASSEDNTPYSDAHSVGAGTHDRMHELSAEMAWEMAGDRAGELPTARQEAWELPVRN